MFAEKTMSVWSSVNKIFTYQADWPEKEEFLDVIYWSRQILGLVIGCVWGLLPLKGFIGILLFGALSAGLIYVWFTAVQGELAVKIFLVKTDYFPGIDEAEYGGAWELTKEGFLSGTAGFFVTWIIVYTGLHIDTL